jgi:hypothetical protein
MPFKDQDKANIQKKAWKEANPEKVKESSRQYYERNKEEIKSKTLARQRENPENRRKTVRRWSLVRKYNITPEQYDAIVERQKGLCAICRKPLDLWACRKPPVDHRHSDGKVRGVVHGNCNRGIGYLGDDSKVLRMAAEYLEAHNG